VHDVRNARAGNVETTRTASIMISTRKIEPLSIFVVAFFLLVVVAVASLDIIFIADAARIRRKRKKNWMTNGLRTVIS
jgi:hypothetical protein